MAFFSLSLMQKQGNSLTLAEIRVLQTSISAVSDNSVHMQ